MRILQRAKEKESEHRQSNTDSRAIVISFPTTSDAMEFRKMCERQGLPGRLIAIPRSMSAGCGYAWRAPVDAEESLLQACRAQGCAYEEARILENV